MTEKAGNTRASSEQDDIADVRHQLFMVDFP